VLALSRGEARLLRASSDELEECQVPGLPPSVKDVSQFDDPQKHMTSHTSGSSPAGRGGQIFHGHGSARDTKDDATFPYLRQVDAALTRFLRREKAPLVLAAPEEVASDFRRTSSCAALMAEGVTGSSGRVSGKDLLARSRAVVERAKGREREAAAKQFVEFLGRGRAAERLDDVLKAAHEGRVTDLFLATDAEARGVYDPATGRAAVKSDSDAESDDLLDLAAALTLRHDGRVYPVLAAKIPGDVASPVAAILRDR
jgi:hypothetical protein